MVESGHVVLTGGSSGIGRALAGQLGARGESVVVGARRPGAPESRHRPIDLASLGSVAEFARGLVDEGRPIDRLVLGAGVHVPWKAISTADGHELHWQVNYLSNFLLTHLLLDLCRRSTGKQIVYVASEAHRLAAAPGGLLGFWRRYARSKEAAITYFLRLQELHPDLRVHIVSPGYVDTEIHDHKSRLAAWLERAGSRVRSPEEVAAEILRVLDGPDTASRYWDRGAPATPSRRCRDPGRAEALWRASIASLQHLLPEAAPCRQITNYARTWRGFGPEVDQPGDLAGLADRVRRAADAGCNVRIVGQRHSYNDCFFSRTAMISIARLDRVLAFDPEAGTITCEGGITIDQVAAYLDQRGYALRYCGNHGRQTLAGALATGTHGYGRDGGVMSELVTAVTVMGADGRLVETAVEADLRALRLALGTLGVIVTVTLAVEPSGPCLYRVACMNRRVFTEALAATALGHDYLRFVPHPFDDDAMLYITIDRTEAHGPTTQPVRYLGAPAGGAAWLLVPWLRMPAVRRVLGRALKVSRHRFEVVVPFSTSLFVRAGVVVSHEGLARIAQRALDRNDWLNLELAVPRDHFAAFATFFDERRPRTAGRSRPYYTCRAVGAASNVLLGPNFERDVVFVDVHADPRAPTSDGFLRVLEAESSVAFGARPHWGKLFHAERDGIARLYPVANLDAFAAAKRRFDPRSVFSNDYSRRVLGL